MKKQRHIIIIFLAFLAASCGKNGDPAKVLQDHIVQDIKDRYGDKFELASFEKINAKNGEVYGIEVTEIQYKAIFKNPKKLMRDIGYYYEDTHNDNWQPRDYNLSNHMNGCQNTDTVIIHESLKATGFVIGSYKRSDDKRVFRVVEPNSEFETKGEEVLHKTENGWIVGRP